MVSVYKILNGLKNYVMDNVDKKYIILGSIIFAIFVFFNLSTILWWAVLAVLLYLLYQSRKQNAEQSDINLDQLCAKNPNLELCKIYIQSALNHKKIMNNIQNRLNSDSGN